MAIWSLTKERVEKLQERIGDKEVEIDTLIKLSPKDLWTQDLDAFVEEWNHQLEEEDKQKKKFARMGRRASAKLGIGGGKGKGKKRKAGDDDSFGEDDSDFGPKKAKKAAVSKTKPGGLLSYLKKDPDPPKKSATQALKNGAATGSTAPKKSTLMEFLKKTDPDGDAMDVDPPKVNTAQPEPVKRGRPAATKKKAIVIDDDDDDEDDVFAAVAKEAEKKPAPTRQPRGAAKKAPKYALSDVDSDDDDGEDLLGDVSSMVKTIGGGKTDRPLFSATAAARPGSNTGISAKGPTRLGSSKITISDDEMDETDYKALMPQPSPARPAPRNVNDTIVESDDEDDFGFSARKATSSKVTSKPIVKAPAKPASKAAASKATKPAAATKLPPAKPIQLSPAAKAYAAKFGKGKAAAAKKKAVDSDEEMSDAADDADAIADDILSEEEPTPKPRGRRAAAVAKPKYVLDDSEEEEDEDDEEEEDDFEVDDSE